MDITTNREISYIRARDPSIQNFNRAHLKNARKNIKEVLGNLSDCSDEIQEENEEEEDNSIQVYLRVKRSQNNETSNYTIQGNELISQIPDQSKNPTYNKYIFTKIFDQDAKQIEIFDFVVKPKILEFINGKDSSLFTYGASGAGKTFTIIGTMDEPGLIPRALEYLFRSLPKLPKVSSVKPLPDGGVSRLDLGEQSVELEVRRKILRSQKSSQRAQNIKTYNAMQRRLSNDPVADCETIAQVSLGVWLAFAEIYNEEIYDLLLPSHDAPPRGKPSRKLRVGLANNHVYVKDLTYVNVADGLDAYQVFQYGIQKIKYAETNLNDHSSRSHSIFSVRIAQALDEGEGAHVSAFNFCDLAGVERSKKTLNVGDRLKESNSINRSLMVFGKCISALRNTQKNNNNNRQPVLIPYRESKLTQLFQRALSGLEEMSMIVNVNTSKNMAEESYNVLNFSMMTKEIIQVAPPPAVVDKKKIPSKIIDKRELLDALDPDIEQVKKIMAEARKKYAEMVEARKTLVETERRETEEGFRDLQEDIKKAHEKRMENLRKNGAFDLETRKKMVLRRRREKVENAKRRKISRANAERRDPRVLREKSKEQVKRIMILEGNVREWMGKMADARNGKESDVVSSKLSDEGESEEGEDVDSFLRHETECESDGKVEGVLGNDDIGSTGSGDEKNGGGVVEEVEVSFGGDYVGSSSAGVNGEESTSSGEGKHGGGEVKKVEGLFGGDYTGNSSAGVGKNDGGEGDEMEGTFGDDAISSSIDGDERKSGGEGLELSDSYESFGIYKRGGLGEKVDLDMESCPRELEDMTFINETKDFRIFE